MIGVQGGDSCGISEIGETPHVALAEEEAHRSPHGKRPPGAEIMANILRSLPRSFSIMCLN
ncbi:hypothetical protein FG382_07650 [Psychrobacillus lasiicapitis]|uniref:Uncharacterized protein n=1 Tax=Psychrobacillus lasiicapitis TaxID=1636719 RepID=A0A544TA41_9BACI|nr:hypothetical protein FG382_07650 [Psychrobacillus lasiicapitis]